jgi:uncharacterized membrane protein YgdD (TMEM256/DUF423 family)
MRWSACGAVLLGLGVAFGAFGAHGLRGRLDEYSLAIYEKAVFYHFIHATGMLIVPVLARVGVLQAAAANRVAILLLVGILIFSGSLYTLAITGNRALGAITPAGGFAFIAAWLILAWEILVSVKSSKRV